MSEIGQQFIDFDVSELIYSRSDGRGVIQDCNRAFIEISGYSWDELDGAPHKLLRAPDMPKGLFYMMWDTIQKGHPIGFYVKNRTKEGKFYWVFANVMPVPDGYISIRIKPTCGTLDKVKPLYAELLEHEKNGLSPQESAEKLAEGLDELGFRNYGEFMDVTFRDELVSRNKARNMPNDPLIDSLTALFDDVRNLEDHTKAVGNTFDATQQIPYNMRLQAGRLEGNDGPISVISGNHRFMTQTLEEHLGRFREDSSMGADAIRQAIYKICVRSLLMDVVEYLSTRSDNIGGHVNKDVGLLTSLTDNYRQTALSDVQGLSRRVEKFSQQCNDMRRMMSGLELSRIMCKIERSKFDANLDGLDEIINRLRDAQDRMGDNFDDILACVARILTSSDGIRRMARMSNPRQVAAA